jgi:hypothetical protein
VRALSNPRAHLRHWRGGKQHRYFDNVLHHRLRNLQPLPKTELENRVLILCSLMRRARHYHLPSTSIDSNPTFANKLPSRMYSVVLLAERSECATGANRIPTRRLNLNPLELFQKSRRSFPIIRFLVD